MYHCGAKWLDNVAYRARTAEVEYKRPGGKPPAHTRLLLLIACCSSSLPLLKRIQCPSSQHVPCCTASRKPRLWNLHKEPLIESYLIILFFLETPTQSISMPASPTPAPSARSVSTSTIPPPSYATEEMAGTRRNIATANTSAGAGAGTNPGANTPATATMSGANTPTTVPDC